MTTCNRCQTTGFLNNEQLPEEVAEKDTDAILQWIASNEDHDVQVCDCCGDGESWYGTPGQHYGPEDPVGPDGPYARNGGLCHCH